MRLAVKGYGLLALACWTAGCEQKPEGGTAPAGVTVFAAASTHEFIARIGAAFEARTGTRVIPSFAASSTLARQIEQGAPCDLFLSADARWIAYLDARGKLAPDTTRDIMGNELVLIANAASPLHVKFEPDFPFARTLKGRLALADPSHVPAGRYAREALENLGWWADLQDRIIPAMDVRQTVRLVERGEATAGIVYRTEVAGVRGLKVVGDIPSGLHTPIRYVAAICGQVRPRAAELLAFLVSAEGRQILEELGFQSLSASRPATASTPP